MRLLPSALLLASLTAALQLPNLQPLLSAIPFPISLSDYIPPTTVNTQREQQQTPSSSPRPHDDALRKRQFSNTCPDNFNSCDNVGAPGLCCADSANCAADDAGNVACCPTGAVCTGVINGVITAGTVDSNGHLVSASGGIESGNVGAAGGGQVVTSVGSSYVITASGSAGDNDNGGAGGGLVAASSPSSIGGPQGTSGGGFIVDGGSTVATPGAGVRGAEVPFVAKVVIRVLEMVPL